MLDERLIEENRARAIQSSAVTRAGRMRTRHGASPASEKCIVHQKKISAARNLTSNSTTGPVVVRTGLLMMPSANKAPRRTTSQAIARGMSRHLWFASELAIVALAGAATRGG
jgi:hypothetical protein